MLIVFPFWSHDRDITCRNSCYHVPFNLHSNEHLTVPKSATRVQHLLTYFTFIYCRRQSLLMARHRGTGQFLQQWFCQC